MVEQRNRNVLRGCLNTNSDGTEETSAVKKLLTHSLGWRVTLVVPVGN